MSTMHLPAQAGIVTLRQASDQLNNTLDSQHSKYYTAGSLPVDHSPQDWRHKRQVSISVTSLTSHELPETLSVSRLHINSSPTNRLINRSPPFRPALPSLRTGGDSPPTILHYRQDSISESPALAGSIITPQNGSSSEVLPKLQHRDASPSITNKLPEYKQTLPPLEIALRELNSTNGRSYAFLGSSSNQPNPYVPTPTFSRSTPSNSLSPPRFSSNPTTWRTMSHNSSSSASSNPPSGMSSASSSSSARRQSPLQPGGLDSEHEANTDVEFSTTADGLPRERFDSNNHPFLDNQGYMCEFPGCTAASFQTQYLLNSHTNVHSNQRPHFCPVEGCPRGPGGQGFKRKNEMIRHGLVHQSPGYVCPFCPDQQHRYPRPDNLQRHVRVHHLERERDDPLLREVLAQRPEGGNRGRRRRLGS